MRMLVPNCSLTRSRTPSTDSAVCVSSRPVGSSARSRLGKCTSARAIATHCIWPPDNWCGQRSARSGTPVRSIITIALERALRTPASCSGSSTFSTALSVGSNCRNWNTKPMRVRRSRVSASSSSDEVFTPSISTSPAEGRSAAPARLRSVVFPQPLRPTSATYSLRSRPMVTPSSARIRRSATT